MLKGKRKKVGGFQKGMGADLKVCNGQSWNCLSKNIMMVVNSNPKKKISSYKSTLI